MPLAASKRRAITASASALAAAALFLAVAGRGCADDPGPAEAVRALALAASGGDRDAVVELLGPATRERLEREARRATELVGGSKRYEAADLVTLGAADESGLPAELEVRYLDDDRAMVSLGKTPDGAGELLVVRDGGRWLIELPAYSHPP
jgi:acetyl-CoA acetyltransferase